MRLQAGIEMLLLKRHAHVQRERVAGIRRFPEDDGLPEADQLLGLHQNLPDQGGCE